MKLKLGWNTLIKVFLCENFGKVSLENFLLTLQEFSKHLKILLSQVVCVSKSIVTIQHNNKKYHSKTKQTKRTIFLSLISWHDCSSESFELVRIPIEKEQYHWEIQSRITRNLFLECNQSYFILLFLRNLKYLFAQFSVCLLHTWRTVITKLSFYYFFSSTKFFWTHFK